MKSLVLALTCFGALTAADCLVKIFDFNAAATVDSWYDYSDVIRDGTGESKAAFLLLDSPTARRAIFFGLADSLLTTSGAALVRTEGNWDWSEYSSLFINLRGPASEGRYYFVLNHKGINNGTRDTRYRLQFEVPTAFATIELPLSDFAPPPDVAEGAEPLDTSYISSLQFAFDTPTSGLLLDTAFEVNWIGLE